MNSRRTVLPLACALAATIPACNPYNNFDGEYWAGSIDPARFPAAYLGKQPGPPEQSGGVIQAVSAYSNGQAVSYYQFPFSASQTSGMGDPLALAPLKPASDAVASGAPTPKAYVFDASATAAFPTTSKCVAPQNYLYDARRDAYRLSEQGVIFTSLPSDDGYVPIIAEVPVTSHGESCQAIKSNRTVLDRNGKGVDVPGTGTPFRSEADGKYLAFALVDPGAAVTPTLTYDDSGAPLENDPAIVHLGWFNQYLVAFLDGGYVPTESVPMTAMNDAYTKMKVQTLFVPTQIPGKDKDGNVVPVKGGLAVDAAGDAPWHILQSTRGSAGYSPVCHVLSYTPDDPLHPETDSTKLSAAELQSAGTADADLGYVYCFQAE